MKRHEQTAKYVRFLPRWWQLAVFNCLMLITASLGAFCMAVNILIEKKLEGFLWLAVSYFILILSEMSIDWRYAPRHLL